ncbi:carboxymuconolactone decarboxylase family protein [Nocardia cyriacigeorgica]|nr:carboxymuconolactone decarboxylase family protein [Nocardia cyriacigeorgica]MBF6453612.1 carboxymuconolactone decarboxylase family protein [Nocardia cyriacigeorgica]MBF6481043.1 carboxymuconolactone decarboxylase family protein [Nocardia cyriacigeorgica]MBF6550780.1 carboxymuconolactone decarboxylase family protein [Nocardia cyriacigeorgica]
MTAVSPRAFELIAELELVLQCEGWADARLEELVRIRISQLNACAYHLDVHTRAALAGGETQQRLNQLAGWRDAQLYSDTERAALALAETLTVLPGFEVPDDTFGAAERLLGPYNLGNLIMIIALANARDRMCLATRTAPPCGADRRM